MFISCKSGQNFPGFIFASSLSFRADSSASNSHGLLFISWHSALKASLGLSFPLLLSGKVAAALLLPSKNGLSPLETPKLPFYWAWALQTGWNQGPSESGICLDLSLKGNEFSLWIFENGSGKDSPRDKTFARLWTSIYQPTSQN